MSWFDSAALKLTLPVFHASPCGLLTRHAAVVRDKGSAPWGRDGSHTAPFCHDGEEVPSLFLSLCQPSRVEGDSWGTPVLSLFSLPVLSCFIRGENITLSRGWQVFSISRLAAYQGGHPGEMVHVMSATQVLTDFSCSVDILANTGFL